MSGRVHALPATDVLDPTHAKDAIAAHLLGLAIGAALIMSLTVIMAVGMRLVSSG